MESVIKKIDNRDEKMLIMKKCEQAFFHGVPDNEQLYNKICMYAEFLAVYVGEKLAGYLAIYANDVKSKMAYITMIGILPQYQRQGLGGDLLKEAKYVAKENNMDFIRLEVNKINHKAIQCYIKYGFVYEMENEKTYYMRYYIV